MKLKNIVLLIISLVVLGTGIIRVYFTTVESFSAKNIAEKYITKTYPNSNISLGRIFQYTDKDISKSGTDVECTTTIDNEECIFNVRVLKNNECFDNFLEQKMTIQATKDYKTILKSVVSENIKVSAVEFDKRPENNSNFEMQMPYYVVVDINIVNPNVQSEEQYDSICNKIKDLVLNSGNKNKLRINLSCKNPIEPNKMLSKSVYFGDGKAIEK